VDNLSDDVLEALAKNSIDNVDELVRLLKAGKYLGSNFDDLSIRIMDRVDSMAQISPEIRKKVVNLYKQKLDELPFLENSDEIKQKLVRDFQTEFDTKFSDKMVRTTASSIGNELDNLLKEVLNNNFDNILNGTKSIDDVLKEFLKTNGKKLSDFYNPKELSDYLMQLKGTLEQTSTKLTSSFDADIEKVWNKMTLAQQREFAKKSIEQITKKIPLSYRDLFDVKKLTTYILKGADNKFSIKLFLSRLTNIWKMSIGVQVLGLLWKGTNITAQQREGYELTWEDKLNYIMNGRSMQEMAFDIIVPFVSWAATLMAAFDKDTQFDELKSQLPLTIRDNIFRNESGKGYYIKQAGVTYPLELHNNQWEIQIDGEWYKLSDVDF